LAFPLFVVFGIPQRDTTVCAMLLE
jgi:hypothetical protein